jgi:hypothetical protein
MRKRILFVVLAVAILFMSSYALAAKPESPPGLSKEKNLKAPGQWKKTNDYENQRLFVNEIHSRIILKLEERGVFPPGIIRLVNNILLSLELATEVESEEKTKVEVTGEVNLSSEGNETLNLLVASFEGLEGKYELKLKVKKQDGNVTVERNTTEGNLTEAQQDLWNNLVDIVISLVEGAEGDDVELEIEIEHELEIEEEEVEEPEPEEVEPEEEE